jgi:hypothetical protein
MAKKKKAAKKAPQKTAKRAKKAAKKGGATKAAKAVKKATKKAAKNTPARPPAGGNGMNTRPAAKKRPSEMAPLAPPTMAPEMGGMERAMTGEEVGPRSFGQ